jgi:hypothetical protein
MSAFFWQGAKLNESTFIDKGPCSCAGRLLAPRTSGWRAPEPRHVRSRSKHLPHFLFSFISKCLADRPVDGGMLNIVTNFASIATTAGIHAIRHKKWRHLTAPPRDDDEQTPNVYSSNMIAATAVGASAPSNRPPSPIASSLKPLRRSATPAGFGAFAITVRPPPATAPATSMYFD